MALITGLTYPNDGDRIKVSNYNTPIQAIVAQVNGNLDTTNMLSGGVNGSVLTPGTVPQAALAPGVAQGWSALGITAAYNANNGNKEFVFTTSSDLTNVLNPGTKLRIVRGTTPPTQSMTFSSASNQYASKSSPSGITFTSAFTAEAWVYMTSYSGTNNTIIGRRDGSSNGWGLTLAGTGQVRTYYASAGSFTQNDSNLSIPLNQWTHVAVAWSSVSSKTGLIYINGVSVPFTQSLSATTTLSQGTGPLEVGGYNGANEMFNGYVSEARVWSIAQSQTSIRANMAVNLVGNETNLVALFQGNGNFNDTTANANNLTPSGGAAATQVANPYNATEYATVISVSYSNPTSTVTVDTGIAGTLPNATLGTVSYSSSASPFGFPGSLNAYTRFTQVNALNFTTSSTSYVALPGMTVTATSPPGGRYTKLTVYIPLVGNGNSGVTTTNISLWNGTVGSGTEIAYAQVNSSGNAGSPVTLTAYIEAAPGTVTYNVGMKVGANTGFATANGDTTVSGAFIMVSPA